MHGVRIGRKAISGELEPSTGRLVQFFGEELCILCGASPQMPGENQFARAFDRHKSIGIATAEAFVGIVLLFAADKSPDLVTLHVIDLHGVNRGL